MVRVATCFDPTGSSSGLRYEPTNYKTAYILGIPKIGIDDPVGSKHVANLIIIN